MLTLQWLTRIGISTRQGSQPRSSRQSGKEGLGKHGAGRRQVSRGRGEMRSQARPLGLGTGSGSVVPVGIPIRRQTRSKPSGAGPGSTAGIARNTPGPADHLNSDQPATVQFRSSSVFEPSRLGMESSAPGAGPPSGQVISIRQQSTVWQGKTRKTRHRQADKCPGVAGKHTVRPGPSDLEPSVDRTHLSASLSDGKLGPSHPEPGPAARRDSHVTLPGRRVISTRINQPWCNSSQAQSVKFEPPLLSNVTGLARAASAKYCTLVGVPK